MWRTAEKSTRQHRVVFRSWGYHVSMHMGNGTYFMIPGLEFLTTNTRHVLTFNVPIVVYYTIDGIFHTWSGRWVPWQRKIITSVFPTSPPISTLDTAI